MILRKLNIEIKQKVFPYFTSKLKFLQIDGFRKPSVKIPQRFF